MVDCKFACPAGNSEDEYSPCSGEGWERVRLREHLTRYHCPGGRNYDEKGSLKKLSKHDVDAMFKHWKINSDDHAREWRSIYRSIWPGSVAVPPPFAPSHKEIRAAIANLSASYTLPQHEITIVRSIYQQVEYALAQTGMINHVNEHISSPHRSENTVGVGYTSGSEYAGGSGAMVGSFLVSAGGYQTNEVSSDGVGDYLPDLDDDSYTSEWSPYYRTM